MKRAFLFLSFACVCVFFLLAQTEDVRVPVNFQEVMIPMRDGVRLQTVILSPKDHKGPLPFLIQRTPYGVPSKEAAGRGMPAATRARYENYYVVTQNIRGRFRSEGKFVMGRAPHDPQDPHGIDETTDAWDTVDWLIKNVPNNNGRAGIAGLFADEPGPRQAEIPVRPDQAGAGDGAGRPDLREGLEGA